MPEPDDDKPSAPEDNAPRTSATDVLGRYGDNAIRMAERIAELERDNYTYRDQRRQLREEVTALKKQVPPEGAVVLAGEQAKAYEAFQKLGKPEEVTAAIEAGKAAQAQLQQHQKGVVLEQAAKVTGFKPGVLRLLAKDLDVEVRQVDVAGEDGQTRQEPRAFVKQADGNAKALRDYFAEQGEDVLASLQAAPAAPDNGAPQTPAAGNGVQYPAQGAGGAAPKPFNPVGDLLAARYVPKAGQAKS